MLNSVISRFSGGGGQPSLSSLTGIGAANNPCSAAGKAKHPKGFTLAEVLITLGIIGVVAAMTLPALIQKNNNKVVETRLMKFYSTINQAIKMAEVDYGDKKYWFEDLAGAEFDKDGKPVPGSSAQEKWFNKYFTPYMKILKTDTMYDGRLIVYFPDGTALALAHHTTVDWFFFTGSRCKVESYDEIHNLYGKCVFSFAFSPVSTSSIWKYHYNKGVEPYKYAWDGDIEQLKKACYNDTALGDSSISGRSYCTALIQLNGWKIPDDYPYKVNY